MILRILGMMVTLILSVILTAQPRQMADIINSYSADKNALRGMYLMNESEEYYKRFTAFYEEWKKQLNTYDFTTFSQEEKVDYLLLKNLVARDAYFLEQDYRDYQEVAIVADFTKQLLPFIQERRRGKKPDSKKLAQLFYSAGEMLDAKKQDLKDTPFSDWIKAEKASKIVRSLARALQESYEFYYGYDPDFTWWVKKPYKELNEKLEAYANFLKEHFAETSVKDDGSGIIGKPIGKDALMKQLAFEYIPYSPEELIKIGEKQFEWCKMEMIKASREMGFGDDWRSALEHVKNTYVPPGEQPQTIMDLYNHSVKFIEDRDLITFPDLAKETWRMIMMTPKRQEVNPFFTGGWEISISYPTFGMEHDDKLMSMRGNNPNFSFPTVQHELLPGHNLQFFMNARHKTYRSVFNTPFWMEGWALYWEILLWNKNFPQTPEQKMGMLFWRIHRCARIIFSLKFHLGNLTPQQCIDLLVNEVGHEYANAEAEVRRSIATSYPPLYQMAYMTGGLQFFALRNEVLEKGWTEKQFHDRVMSENIMPVEMLRVLILDLPVKKDHKSQWKFSTEFK